MQRSKRRAVDANDLLDHLVGKREQFVGNLEVERLRRLEIDHQLELGGCSTGISPGFAPFRILST